MISIELTPTNLTFRYTNHRACPPSGASWPAASSTGPPSSTRGSPPSGTSRASTTTGTGSGHFRQRGCRR